MSKILICGNNIPQATGELPGFSELVAQYENAPVLSVSVDAENLRLLDEHREWVTEEADPAKAPDLVEYASKIVLFVSVTGKGHLFGSRRSHNGFESLIERAQQADKELHIVEPGAVQAKVTALQEAIRLKNT